MGGAIVQDEGHRVHLAPERFGNDDLLEKGLEIHKAFARAAQAVDLAIGHREASKQLARATPLVARFVQQRLAWLGWAWRLFALACLDGGFLIQAQQPDACRQQRSCLAIGVQDRTGTLQEGDRIMDMLPSVKAPRTQAFGGSASVPPCWPRWTAGWDLGPRDGPIRHDSSAKVGLGAGAASYRRWR